MNLTILIGNLTDNPEMAVTQSGISVCKFRLAVQRRFANAQGQREADFINIVVWRQLAELCGKYLGKGRKCAVKGSLQTRSYKANDGSTRYITEVIAEEVQFLGNPAGQNNAGSAPQDGFVPVDDDELPF